MEIAFRARGVESLGWPKLARMEDGQIAIGSSLTCLLIGNRNACMRIGLSSVMASILASITLTLQLMVA